MENTTRNRQATNYFDHFYFYLPDYKEPTPEQVALYEQATYNFFDPEAHELVKSFFMIEAKRAEEREPGHNKNVIEPAFTALLAYFAGKAAGIREERKRRLHQDK